MSCVKIEEFSSSHSEQLICFIGYPFHTRHLSYLLTSMVFSFSYLLTCPRSCSLCPYPLSLAVPMIKTEPADDYESRMSIHANPYFGQQRLPTMMPLDDPEPCMVASYAPCASRPTPMLCSSPSSSPKLHDLSPVPFPKCLSNSPTHSTMPGGMASMQDPPTHHGLALPSSPDPTSLAMHHPQGSPHLGSPSYHPLYPNSSPSSSPNSHPSTPGAATESPYLATFGSTQPGGSSPTLLADDHASPVLPVTIKQEPQELDQMYLDDGRLRNHNHSITSLSSSWLKCYILSTLLFLYFCSKWNNTKSLSLLLNQT